MSKGQLNIRESGLYMRYNSQNFLLLSFDSSHLFSVMPLAFLFNVNKVKFYDSF